VWDGLDIRVGRMIQNWGSADQFNPTDNLNSRDLSDPLDYSRKVPNQMVEVELFPADWMSISLVWVPVFKPAQLPPSSVLAFAVENDEAGCFKSAPTPPIPPSEVAELEDLFASVDNCMLDFADPEVRTLTPAATLANSQVAAKVNFLAGPLDFALSYYYGRFGFPTPYTAVAHVDKAGVDSSVLDVKYVAEVVYPRMHVAGLDFSYSADWLFGVGFAGEMALIFPEEVVFGLQAWRGEAKVVENSAVNVPSEPFVKGTIGLDYTFPFGLYLNAMYIRGFFDEFNDAYGIHNLTVGALEFKLFEDELQFRMSAIVDIDDKSRTLNPQMTWIAFPSAQVILTGLILLGDTEAADPRDYASKYRFGQKAAGRSVVSLKARVTW